MLTIACRGVEDTYNRLCRTVNQLGKIQDSRNGRVKVMDGPCIIQIREPQERVLLNAERDANPFFHLFESLWMLAGSNEVAFIQQFNKQIGAYSDDGLTFNAAYGHRWRRHFGYDQIAKAIEMLRLNPLDRRVVISQWDPRADLGADSKDIPCNQQIMPRVYEGKLNFLTTNRSNDVIWGLCGANAVHLTVLMELMARAVGLPLGEWVHVSNNLHIYEKHWDMVSRIRADQHVHWWPYIHGLNGGKGVKPQPLITGDETYQQFMADCEAFVLGQDDDFTTEFFDTTVAPMIQGWHKWRRDGDMAGALYDVSCMEATDWRIACTRWLNRRKK